MYDFVRDKMIGHTAHKGHVTEENVKFEIKELSARVKALEKINKDKCARRESYGYWSVIIFSCVATLLVTAEIVLKVKGIL